MVLWFSIALRFNDETFAPTACPLVQKRSTAARRASAHCEACILLAKIALVL
jgi:hypothetical protein